MSDTIKEQAEAVARESMVDNAWGGLITIDVLVPWIENALRLRESLSALVAQTAHHDRRDHMCSQCAAIDEALAQIAAHDKLVKGGR